MRAQIIDFRCTLKNRLGHFISYSLNRDVINQVDPSNNTLKGLVAGLQNVRPGEHRQIFVNASEGYGLYNPKLVKKTALSFFGKNARRLKVGAEVRVRLDGDPHERLYRVLELDREIATLDANHALAGQDLIFDVEITGARHATADDLGESETADGQTLH